MKSKHQFVISTHSPAIVRKLPKKAIKVVAHDKKNDWVKLINQECPSEEAFFYIGEQSLGKLSLVVEDILARNLVHKALRIGGDYFFNRFEVRHYPGGAQTLWQYYLPTYAAEGRNDVLVLMDGDQRPEVTLPNPEDTPPSQEDELKSKLKAVAGCDVNFWVDGGAAGKDLKQESDARRSFVKWVLANVDYLPSEHSPEEFVWSKMTKSGLANEIDGSQGAKKRFEILTRKQLGRADEEAVTSMEIALIQEQCLATIPSDDPDIVSLYARLRAFSERK